MAIPLRVVQKFYVGADGRREWVGYALEVKTASGWEPVPVVMEEVPAPRSIIDIAVESE
jgi:serine protease inhibitor ecotin